MDNLSGMCWMDRRLQIATGVTVLAALLMGLLIVLDTDNLLPLAVLIIGLAGAVQFSALFWRGRSTDPFSQAQTLFVQGQHAAAAQQLEVLENPDTRSRTLLGNVYRQMGRLDESEILLRTVVEANLKDAFPLYGLGRTLLAKGDFAEAAQRIAQSLNQGGRKATGAELALAHYFNGDLTAAGQTAQRVSRQLQLEPYRRLMVNYILYQVLNDSRSLGVMAQVKNSLPYWQAEADRFSHTPYGACLQQEIANIQSLLSEGVT